MSIDTETNRTQLRNAFAGVYRLLALHLITSAGTLAVAYRLRHHADLVNAGVWIRGSIVLVSAVVMLALAVRAAGGSRAALKRLRIIAPVVLAGTVLVVAVPGMLPLWMRCEQAACGIFLAGIVAIVHSRQVRVPA